MTTVHDQIAAALQKKGVAAFAGESQAHHAIFAMRSKVFWFFFPSPGNGVTAEFYENDQVSEGKLYPTLLEGIGARLEQLPPRPSVDAIWKALETPSDPTTIEQDESWLLDEEFEIPDGWEARPEEKKVMEGFAHQEADGRVLKGDRWSLSCAFAALGEKLIRKCPPTPGRLRAMILLVETRKLAIMACPP